MNKMRILVATVVALGLAAPALAADVKLSGDFNNRFSYSTQADLSTQGNVSIDTSDYINGNGRAPGDFTKADNDDDFFAEAKYRVWMTASDDEKKIKGVLGLEFGAAKYGSTQMDFGGDDRNFLEVMHLYTVLEVPFDTASTLSLGLQPVGYNKFVWSDNAAGAKYASKRGPLAYSLGWFRNDVTAIGGDSRTNNDNVYALDATFDLSEGNKINGFVMYREDGNYNGAGTNGSNREFWYGVSGQAQVANVFLGGTTVYLGGEVTDWAGAGFNGDMDRKAFLLNGEATVKIANVRLKAGYLYASGDDDATDNELNNFDSIDVYMGGFGSVVVFDSFADDNTMVSSPYIQDKGLSMPYLSVDFDITDKFTVGASYLYIAAAEDLGTGIDATIGNEIAARASYTITKGLTAGIASGYLVVGNGIDDVNKALYGTSADDIFRTEASIRYKF